MVQTDPLVGDSRRDSTTVLAVARVDLPTREAVKAAPEVVPFAVDVLFVGNTTRTLATLAKALESVNLTSRDTLAVDALFTLGGRQLPDLILIDDEAAGIDALEFVSRVARSPRLRDVPTMLLSTETDIDRKVEAFSAGIVDYVCTPVATEELLARVLTHVRLRRAQLESELHSRKLEAFVLEQVNEITDSQMATIIALARLAESRDDQTGGHLERVQQYCRMIAARLSEQMRFGIIDHTFIDNIEYASALHDIGKVAISDLILLKPAELTDDEFELMKSHTQLGAETLEAVSSKYPNNDFIEMGIKIARWHHERWDGSGYPDGLVGEAIPLPARIMAVADVYDALMSQRSYKRPFTYGESRDIIASQRGEHFDPDVVDAFLSLEAEFVAVDRV
jgi:putative two-component system response regulator